MREIDILIGAPLSGSEKARTAWMVSNGYMADIHSGHSLCTPSYRYTEKYWKYWGVVRTYEECRASG